MKNIAIYGKSISDNNLKFLEALIVTLKDELNTQLFIHQSLEEHSSLIERFNIIFFNYSFTNLFVTSNDFLL